MNIEQKENKLHITFDKEEVGMINEYLGQKAYSSIWRELFYNDVGSLGNNSDYDYWDSGSLMHEFCGALTSSPLITKGATMDDDGNITDVDIVSWIPSYQVESEFDYLPDIEFEIAAQKL